MKEYILVGDIHRNQIKGAKAPGEEIIAALDDMDANLQRFVSPMRDMESEGDALPGLADELESIFHRINNFHRTIATGVVSLDELSERAEGEQIRAIENYAHRQIYVEGNTQCYELPMEATLEKAVEDGRKVNSLDRFNPFYSPVLFTRRAPGRVPKILQRLREGVWTAYMIMKGPGIAIMGGEHPAYIKRNLGFLGLAAKIENEETITSAIRTSAQMDDASISGESN